MDYPKSDPNAGLNNNKFTDGNPATGIPASRDRAEYQNWVFDEIINAIKAGGLDPDETKQNQLAVVIAKLLSAHGKELGESFWHQGERPPAKAMFFTSQELSRTQYKELWDALNEPDRNITFVTDAEYLAGRRGFWSTGDGSTTFRAPDPRALVLRVLDSGAEIDIGRVAGSYQSDAIRNIIGTVTNVFSVSHTFDDSNATGAFLVGDETPTNMNVIVGASGDKFFNFSIDASRTVPTAAENLMKNMAWPLAFYYE